MSKTLKLGVIVVFASQLLGCDLFGNDTDKLSNIDLRKEWKTCKHISNPSRTKALACENYQKQCDKRKKAGNLACY